MAQAPADSSDAQLEKCFESYNIIVLGAGVIGLTTAHELQDVFPRAQITIVSEYFPTDPVVDHSYCSGYVRSSSSYNDIC